MKKFSFHFLCLGIFIAIISLVLITRHKVAQVHNSEKISSDASQSFLLYVPSPYELSMINQNKDIWPRRFSRQMPPSLTDLPLIYLSFVKAYPQSKREIDFFRSLAMTANLEEWNAFKDILSFKLQLKKNTTITPKNLLKWLKQENCSIFAQEVAYRILQWQPDLLSEIYSYYQACDPNSFHSFWLEILIEQKTKDFEKLKKLQNSIQSRREKVMNDTYEYFVLTQAFNVLDLTLAHEFKAQSE